MKKHTFNNLTATLGGNRKQKRITEHQQNITALFHSGTDLSAQEKKLIGAKVLNTTVQHDEDKSVHKAYIN